MGSMQHDHLTPASSPRPWTHCPRRASRAQLQRHDAPSRLWTLVHRRLVDLSSALFPAPLRTVNGLPHPKSFPNTSSHGELPVARAPCRRRTGRSWTWTPADGPTALSIPWCSPRQMRPRRGSVQNLYVEDSVTFVWLIHQLQQYFSLRTNQPQRPTNSIFLSEQIISINQQPNKHVVYARNYDLRCRYYIMESI
jgi:hypothetical protein